MAAAAKQVAHEPTGPTLEPTLQGEAHPGLLTNAAEAARELAHSAAGTLTHAAAVATGEGGAPRHARHYL